MPQLELRLAALVQLLWNDLLLAEALLFPTASYLHDRPARLRELMARGIAKIVKQLPPGQIYRYRLEEIPELHQLRIDVPPARGDLLRCEPVKLTFHYVQWRHGDEALIAAVPSLGIEIIAENERQLSEQLEPQIRSALTRRKSADSLRDLVMLGSIQDLRIKPLRISVKLPTLKQLAQQSEESSEKSKSVLKEAATNLDRQPYWPIYERDELVRRLAQMLSARIPRSVLLVGQSGVGKTALVRELARRRREFGIGDTPFWSTSGSRLIAGMSGFGMWQDRCQRLEREVAKTKAVIHMDNLVELIEVGKGGGNTQGIAAMLRPSIARGSLLAIAECTPEQLAVIERQDPQLLEAFTLLELPETTPAQTLAILTRVAENAASRGQPVISESALAELDRLHRRYATYSASPGRPLRFLLNLLEDRHRLMNLGALESSFGQKAEKSFESPSNNDHTRTANEITLEDVTSAFSHETGLPLFMLDDSVPLDLGETREWLAARVMGQTEPVELLTDLLAAVKAGLSRGGKPIASLLFIGPTGVGKTEMAKALAEFLYQDPGRMIRFDMSEYAYPAAVERLIGGSYASQGLLTQKVRDQPFMVVLLDEFEKADPSVFDMLLQVLGEGRLTDAAGRVADFTNSVVIMTSNLGAESFRRAAFGFVAPETKTVQRHFEREVKAFLRPEMFNRIDRIVPFTPLSPETIADIARREIDRLSKRDGLLLRNVKVHVESEAIQHLAASGFDLRYGARPLRRAIERQLATPLADHLCRYSRDVAIDCHVRIAEGKLIVDAHATNSGQRQSLLVANEKDAIHELNAVLTLRRETQALERSGSILRLRNEIYRRKQSERQRRRRLKRRGLESRFEFSVADARLKAQEGLLHQVDELVRQAFRLEEVALRDLYTDRQVETGPISRQREQLDQQLRELLFQLYLDQTEAQSLLTIALYGINLHRVFELADAYEHVASDQQSRRFWLKMHDKELERKRQGVGKPLPQMPLIYLTNRKQHAEDVSEKVVDVYSPPPDQFHHPPSDVIGAAIVIQNARAKALLETENGRHEFFRKEGKPDVCFVETHEGLLIKYDPPADVGRVSAFRDLGLRREYNPQAEFYYDALLNGTFSLRGQSLEQVVRQATSAYLTRRVWSMLE